jgi:hypothetical protein
VPFRRRKNQGADRLTVGLAAAALGTAGTVLAGHIERMARRRLAQSKESGEPSGVLSSAELAIAATTKATQDSLTVAIEGYSAAPKGETILFNMLSGFTGAFAVMRLSTWGIRSGWWPLGNVKVGGRHVHHFVPGILAAFLAGGAGLISDNDRLQQILAVPFGAGIGMTFDEAALLLELDDVYWTEEGVLSLQVSFATIGMLAAIALGVRVLRRGESSVGITPAPGS